MSETQLRLVVLYADISGSTRIFEQYGDTVARADIRECLALLSDVASNNEGKIIKTIGDEVMCVFYNPVKAANASIEMHQALEGACEQGRFQSEALHIKIGWHYGSAGFRPDDVIGEAPAIAQQVIKIAKRDETLTTGKSIDSLPPELRLKAVFIDRIEAEDGSGDIEVYSIPWEEDYSEVTVLSQQPAQGNALMHTALVLVYAGKELRLDSNRTHCQIGRGEDNDLVVNGEYTSRHHAEIHYRHGRFHLSDMSTNGTALVHSDGHMTRLHREEEMLSGSGLICFGGEPKIDPHAQVQYECMDNDPSLSMSV